MRSTECRHQEATRRGRTSSWHLQDSTWIQTSWITLFYSFIKGNKLSTKSCVCHLQQRPSVLTTPPPPPLLSLSLPVCSFMPSQLLNKQHPNSGFSSGFTSGSQVEQNFSPDHLEAPGRRRSNNTVEQNWRQTLLERWFKCVQCVTAIIKTIHSRVIREDQEENQSWAAKLTQDINFKSLYFTFCTNWKQQAGVQRPWLSLLWNKIKHWTAQANPSSSCSCEKVR